MRSLRALLARLGAFLRGLLAPAPPALEEPPPRPSAASTMPTRAEVQAAWARLVAKRTCHDMRCRGFGQHPCHSLDCKHHAGAS